MRILITLLFGLSAVMVGCSTTQLPDTSQPSSFEVTYPEPRPVVEERTGSIFDNGAELYPAGRAYSTGAVRVGDIITVVLNEAAQAQRVTGLTTERVSVNNISDGIFPDGTLADDLTNQAALGSTISSAGNGTAGQSASLTGSISVVVLEVMSNGNLIVLGEKQLELNEGSEIIRVSGVIRPEDIQPNNTVLSRRLANAQFSYSGAGALSRSTKVPWGTNILFGIWPF
jgi:flagellar L-ring protein precursor FlgH